MTRALASLALLLLVVFAASCKREGATPAPSPPASSAASRGATQPASGQAASAAPAPSEAPSAAASPRRAWTRPFLYRVVDPRAPAGAKASYLFGTIHLPDERLDVFPPPLADALASADAVYTEIPMDPGTQLTMTPKLLLPNGQTLHAVAPRDLCEKVEGLFAERMLPFAPFSTMKPWVIATQLVLLDKLMVLAVKKPLDMVIYSNATRAGKQVFGLETVDEQLAVFDGLSQAEQVEMLRATVQLLEKQKKEGRDATEELLAPYVAGDDAKLRDAITAGFDPKDKLSAKLLKRLFTERNERMAQRAAARMKGAPDKAHFFAVGAGHVVGDDGVVSRLAKMGYTVARVEP